jgi:hypothetical protein
VLRRIFGLRWTRQEGSRENYIMRSLMICILDREGVNRVLVGNPRERDHLGDPVVDGRIILR